MIKNNLYLILLLVSIVWLTSCNNVDEGYRIEYGESTAQFTVTLLSADRGVIGDTISFSLQATSETDIKSLVVESSVSGTDGTGFIVPSGTIDPLIDHVYGTIQQGIHEINLVYQYVVSQDSVNANIAFTLIDNSGKKVQKQTVLTIPSIVKYSGIILYTQSSTKTDGFSTVDGVIYRNLQNYEAVNSVNETIQESLDIIFQVRDDTAMLVAPYNGNFTSTMRIRNKTLFKAMPGVTSSEFDKLTNVSLSKIVETNEVKKGSTILWNIRMGDIVGFRTDFASTNPYHYGLIRIKSMHPATVSFYDGECYLIEMDITVQK